MSGEVRSLGEYHVYQKSNNVTGVCVLRFIFTSLHKQVLLYALCKILNSLSLSLLYNSQLQHNFLPNTQT